MNKEEVLNTCNVMEQEDIDFEIDMLKEYSQMQSKIKFEIFQFKKEIEKEHPDFIIQLKEEKVKKLTAEYQRITENTEKAVWRGKLPEWLIKVIKELQHPDKIFKEVKKLMKEIDFLKGRDFIKEGEITHQDIANAKKHPFENLIETQNGKAVCPFHPEDTPSFSIHKEGNFGYCFGCNKGVDTIQFIMETKNMSFVDAVKLLR